MKILHKSKRVIPPPLPVAELIEKLLGTPTDELTQVLSQIDIWLWPRSDLNAWIKVLNKFDSILEEYIVTYDVDKLQLNPFTPGTKQTISEILRFERMLLENSTNRKMFGSYDRLNSLLQTSDLDILVLALNLLLRPSQQYSAQPSVSHALNISTPRLQSLAKRWPHLREYGVSLVDLTSSKPSTELDALPTEALEVNFVFYRAEVAVSENDKYDTDAFDVSSTSPRKAHMPPSSSATNIHIDEQTILSTPTMNILANILDEHSVPDAERYELLCRIRAAKVLTKGQEVDRGKLAIVRLLAIAIYGHTHSESQASASLFLYEPDLIPHVAELLQVDHGIPLHVQTAAMAALDALARYRSKIQEVLTAVNAGVNHGILMALVRKTVADISSPESKVPQAFVEALLSFLTYIASHASGGNMVVGAGLIPLLIQLIENKSSIRLPVVSKTMQLVDNVLYSFTNAFNLFCAARGIDVLVGRIEYEIDNNIREFGDTPQSRDICGVSVLPVTRVAVLKHILRSMHRMMQSSGTAEGLRGLIDMSLLKSIKKIIEYRGLFGSSIVPIAINIMATFVHNEPTSLAIIQEAGLPETFYRAIEFGIEPAIEIIQAIPNAIGALCLNDVGRAQLAKRPSVIPAIFSIFTSEQHLKVLADKENAVLIGTAIDELIRHHPLLKVAIFDALKSTLITIEEIGMSFTIPQPIRHWYRLMPAENLQLSSDIAMGELDLKVPSSSLQSQINVDGENDVNVDDDEPSSKAHENNVVSFIDVLGRFLEGLFQHTPHCKDFIAATDGLTRLGKLTGLPCLPYDFANSVASDSMVQVMRTMIEVSTSETLLHLARLVRESMEETRYFWEDAGEKSKLLSLVDITAGEQEDDANVRFRSLVTLHIRITLLSDVFATAGYAHGRAAIGLLQTLMTNTSPQVVVDLGALHRASIWENVILNAGLASKGIDLQATPSFSPMETSPNTSAINLPETEGMASTSTGTTNGVQPEAGNPNLLVKQATKQNGYRDQNAAALKHLTHGLPGALAPFFQAMVKMFHARRNPDPAQKKQISESSAVVAEIMMKHLTLKKPHDLPSIYTYYSVVFGLFTLLLVDERPATSTLHTVQLFAFYRAGGLTAIVDVCTGMMVTIDEIVKIREEDRTQQQKQELLHAYGGIKVALHLLLPIITSKPLFESGQTLLIMTRDKKDTELEYFEPHNFLVKLRAATLPLVRRLWESPWLIQAPIGVTKFIVRNVLQLVNGDSEESKGEPAIDAGPSSTGFPRQPGPDENRIQMLTDMGFPRSAAERALTRTHNNVNAATELLLAHPFPLPPDPDPEPESEPEPVTSDLIGQPPAAPTDDSIPAEQVVDSSIGEEAPVAVSSEDTLSMVGTLGKTTEEWRKNLDEGRESLRQTLSEKALLLIDEHISLLFDLHVAFTKSGSVHQGQAIRDLVDDIKRFSPFAYDVQEQPLANRCRLLALVLCENPTLLDVELRTTLLEHLLALLLSSIDPERPPRWLAAHLLVTEALFTLAEEPRSITVPKEDEPIASEPLFQGPVLTEARHIVFDFCLRLLAVKDLPADELLSVLRLFVLFTRREEIAAQFAARDGPNLIFQRIRASAVAGSSSYIAIILRHIVEDTSTVNRFMNSGIKRYFSQPRTLDFHIFVRNSSAMALRDPQVFMEMTKALCQLEKPFSSSPHIILRSDSSSANKTPQDKAPQEPAGNIGDMQIDSQGPGSVPTPITNKNVESIVHLLIGELMSTMKIINDVPSTDVAPDISSSTAEISSDPSYNARQDSNLVPEDLPPSSTNGIDIFDKYQYLCFLMQCLTELLFSYDQCKLAFLSYSPRKRLQTPAKESAGKFKSATLHFLLSDLITYGTIHAQSSPRARNRITLCNWAMSVIVALCVDSSSVQDKGDVASDLVSVRKFVLETLSRAIKELSPSDNMESRYGRLLALADLCHRLLTVRFNASSRKQQEDVPTHIAKIMLEKGFVATLTTAISEIDLNYPNVRSAVASILRPLEHLTKIAIKMSRSAGKHKDTTEGAKAASVSSMDSSDDEESLDDTGREETPDLYRNSALGMYGGEMDDGHFGDDDEMDEDEEDEDEDVEMDFGEETGSEDTSNTEDERDEDGLDNIAHDSEVWEEAGDDDEEHLVENNEDDEDDESDSGEHDEDVEGDDDDEGDEEMMWEDIQVEAEGLRPPGEDGDDDEERRVPIQVIHEEEDEPDMASDDEEYIMDNGIFNADDVFHFGSVNVGHTRDLGGLFVPRRHRTGVDENMPVFGRARNAPAPVPEATVHPLLLDITAPANRGAGIQSRITRHPARVIATDATDLFQTIDEIIGNGSVQLFQQIMSRGRGGGGPETFRLDVPSGTLVNLERSLQRRGPQGGFSAIRVDRAPRPQNQRPIRELDPMLTLQRWAEEIKILNGDFVAERVGKLENHILLALLPAAVEAAKEAKIREEEEASKSPDVPRETDQEVPTDANLVPEQAINDPDRIITEETSVEQLNPPVTVSSATPQVPDHPMQEESTALDVDTEMTDAAADTVPRPISETTPIQQSPSLIIVGEPSAASSTLPIVAERVTVMIHGSAVDITDTGIDPTFLEALPDDMREEVLNQHVRDQRAARVERPPDSQISTEFLDALPPEIRAEIIQQEAIERARRRAEDVATPGTAPPGAPADIDPASFIASLDPTLRQAVLMEQDDGFIQTLPSHMIAEAGAYRDNLQPRRHLATRGAVRSIPTTSAHNRKYTPQHDAILLLDKAGIATLIRLLFFPQVLKKTLLFKVLVNLCENAKTRTELFNLLLSILQDGTGDLTAVDKSFSQLSVRNSKPPLTPKATGKQKAGNDYLTAFALPTTQMETVPDLIAQRCLESLTYIVSSNELASLFFLTEHELPIGLRKGVSKKGKGKEKQAPQTHYPIVLLLGLLDRQSLLRTPAIMESVVGLLATVTRPLTSLKDTKQATTTEASMSLPEAPINRDIVIPEATISAVTPSSTAPLSHVEVTDDQQTRDPTAADNNISNTAAQQAVPEKDTKLSIEAVEEKILLANPPQVPHAVLRLIVNILTVGECSGRTFQQSLALIQHLSYIPDARDVIANELKSKAQEFGQALFAELDELAVALVGSESELLLSSVAVKFSPASATQAKLLRVLKTIDYMYTPKSSGASGTSNPDDVEKVQGIYETFRFTPLWRRLGDCLSIVEEKPDTEHIATVLLPLIEALMVVCKYVGSKAQAATLPRVLRASASPRSPITPRESMEDLFISFTDAHRKCLNLMVRNNPSLMSGSFSLLVNNPRVLDFDNKRNYFNQQLHRRPHAREHHGTLQLNVRRARVFEDSFQYLQRKTGEQIKHGKLSVRFYDEAGVDAGGVTREWFQILARQMFDPNNALFQPCAADKLTYQPNKNSWINQEHLSFFKFVGRVIGKAIYDGRLLDAYFARSLYRQLLGKPVDYKDVEWVDPEYYNSLCWILENDPTLLDLTFSVEADEFGVNRIVPLKEGGETVPVTQENKREFVQLSAQYRLYSSIKEQIENLSNGFYEIIPKDLITIFNEQELELLISGTPDIDVDEWRAATEYNGYTSSDPNIVWWWRALKSFDRDERAKVLSFATGTSRVPLSGFVDLQGVQGVQRFSIHRAYGESDRLPQAHTCFNQIDLPQYTSYEMLRQQLLMAINEGGEGFAFS